MNFKAYFFRAATITILCAMAAAAGIGVKQGWFMAGGSKAAIAQQKEKEEVEVELITIRRFGFEPAEIKRPAGEVAFIINNRSNVQDLSLTLNRVQGNRPTDKVKDVGLRKGQVNWIERFNLPPGDYVLTETSRPDWKCSITLAPPKTQ